MAKKPISEGHIIAPAEQIKKLWEILEYTSMFKGDVISMAASRFIQAAIATLAIRVWGWEGARRLWDERSAKEIKGTKKKSRT